ncbi:MAG: SIR2 family protein [Acidimicrobiales bacterium]
MRELGVEEFVRRLRRLLARDGLVAFFLGAGASISSGIPGAAALAERWAKELHETEAGDGEPFDEWRSARLPEFDPGDPSRSYATVMRRLFPTQAERQQEIERVVAEHDPGFAYATLAQLMADPDRGPKCNVVLTTNFDDLVADALYLYTRSRPLVVTHEALVTYAAVGRTRTTVIKLHGDAMLQPRNTDDEIAELAPALIEALRRHLHSRALVVIGYGGNDRGVFRALSALPPDTITRGVYWVSDRIPDNAFGAWLRQHDEAFHVRHLDFDELMAIVRTEFDLPNPDEERFSVLMDRYRTTFSTLRARVQADESPSSLVARSVEEVRKRFGNWFSVELEAQQFKTADPERAEQIYEAGLAEFPKSEQLLGNYAIFLKNVRHDYDRAQELYERAIAADPNSANKLGNYAGFLYAMGKPSAARDRIARARSLKDFEDERNQPLRLEIAFYELANEDLAPEEQRRLLEVIASQLGQGGRSPGWGFGPNLERAAEQGKSKDELEFLEVLAAVIADEAPVTDLDRFPPWPPDRHR